MEARQLAFNLSLTDDSPPPEPPKRELPEGAVRLQWGPTLGYSGPDGHIQYLYGQEWVALFSTHPRWKPEDKERIVRLFLEWWPAVKEAAEGAGLRPVGLGKAWDDDLYVYCRGLSWHRSFTPSVEAVGRRFSVLPNILYMPAHVDPYICKEGV